MLAKVGFLLAFIGCAFASDVMDLSDSDFESKVKDQDIMLIEFFAPWCGHCKRLAPEYETAATALLKNDPPVPLAKVDCTEAGKDTCSKHGVSGYPTLKIFRNGKISKDYDGPREASGIVSYMKKQAGPSSTEIKDMDHMKRKVLDSETAVAVGFFSGGDEDLEKAFKKAADGLREKYTFAHTSNAEVMENFGHKDEVVLYRPSHLHSKFENNKEVYSGSADDFYIEKFLKAKVHGLAGHMTQDNQDQFNKPLCAVYYNVDYKLNRKGTNYWRNRVLKVAKSFGDKVMNYAIAKSSEFGRLMNDMGVKLDEDKDAVVPVITNDVGDRFVMREKFSVDSFKKFLQDYFDGNLKPFVKSEPVPEPNDGPVKVVVGENFKEIVNDPTKDVLIEFYAPWCGHCKSLEPKYNELGEKLQGVEDIVIAKMDATANDAPPAFKVEGFPTIYWAPKNNKDNPEKYQGGREVSDFVTFLKNKASTPFSLDEKKKKKKKEEL